MRKLVHIIGLAGIAIVFDFIMFDGYCTQFACDAAAQVANQIRPELVQFKSYF